MAATPKVSTQEITNALLRWQGNVQAAADHLGLSRNGLYKRIDLLGLNLSGFRRVPSTMPTNTVVSTMPIVSVASDGARKNTPANFPGMGRRTTFARMDAQTTDEALPVRTLPPKPKPLRIEPANQERLRIAVRRIAAAYGIDTDQNLVLNQILEEVTERWTDEKEALARPAEKKVRKGKTQDGEK